MRRIARSLAALLALLTLTAAPLRAAAGCDMPAPADVASAPMTGGHEHHQGPHDPGPPASHDRCPDLAGCTPPFTPAAGHAGLGMDEPAARAPIASPVAMRRGPVATLDPPPPRS